MNLRLWIVIVMLVTFRAAALAQPRSPMDGHRGAASRPSASTQPQSEGADQLCATDHELRVGDRVLSYRATAGTLALKDDAGKPRANFFFVAYELKREVDDEASLRARPITFVFNGGPGAAAVWLHLGAAGPKRVDVADDGAPPAPPYRLVDNEQTWLDVTDLVFIDPVGTGFSRAAPDQKPEEFYGVEKDIASVADFIRIYTTRYGRWPSPKFLAGESYGTTRAAGLSEFLVDRYGIALNGVMLLSCVLNFETIQLHEGNNLPYPLYLPSYAAIAWHHKRLPPDLQNRELPKLLDEVQRWAIESYAVALARGDALSHEQRVATIGKLAGYTSLSKEFIERANLRISPGEFAKRLLDPEKKLLGRFDARIIGVDPNPTQPWPSYDPSLAPFFSAYSATFNDYVRRVLSFESELPYEVLTDKVGPWDFGRQGGGYLDVGDNLRSAMIKTPAMRVLIGSSYFDLATPYFATDYTVNQLSLPPEVRSRVTQTYYNAGHMMYHDRASREKLKGDVAGFVKGAVAKSE